MKQEVMAFTSKVLEAAAHLCIVILMASAKLSQMALVFAPLGGGRQKRGKITMRILIWLFTTGWELCCVTFCQSVLTFAAWLSFASGKCASCPFSDELLQQGREIVFAQLKSVGCQLPVDCVAEGQPFYLCALEAILQQAGDPDALAFHSAENSFASGVRLGVNCVLLACRLSSLLRHTGGIMTISQSRQNCGRTTSLHRNIVMWYRNSLRKRLHWEP